MEEFKGDKRTKEYKEWKAKKEAESKGLGDSIKKITKATGIDKVVNFVAGEDCGCDERAEKLNEIFNYNKPKCFTEDEYFFVKDLKERNPSVILRKEVKKIYEIHNRVFSLTDEPSACTTCVQDRIKRLKRIYETYS